MIPISQPSPAIKRFLQAQKQGLSNFADGTYRDPIGQAYVYDDKTGIFVLDEKKDTDAWIQFDPWFDGKPKCECGIASVYGEKASEEMHSGYCALASASKQKEFKKTGRY